jgi:hypothetical protein
VWSDTDDDRLGNWNAAVVENKVEDDDDDKVLRAGEIGTGEKDDMDADSSSELELSNDDNDDEAVLRGRGNCTCSSDDGSIVGYTFVRVGVDSICRGNAFL